MEKETKIDNVSVIAHLKTFNGYYFKVMNKNDHQSALKLLIKLFTETNPLNKALKTFQPSFQVSVQQMETVYWSSQIDEVIRQQLGIAVYTSSKTDPASIIGVFTTIDLASDVDNFSPLTQVNSLEPQNFMRQLYNELAQKLPQGVRQIIERKQKGEVQNMSGIAINGLHSGKGIFKELLLSGIELGIKKGYRYAFSFTTNAKTYYMFDKLGFSTVAKIDAKEFTWKGIKPYQMIEEDSRYPTLFWKQYQQQ